MRNIFFLFLALGLSVLPGSCGPDDPPRFPHHADVSALAGIHVSRDIPSLYRHFLKTGLHDTYKVTAIAGMDPATGERTRDGIRERVSGAVIHRRPDNPNCGDIIDISVTLYDTTAMASSSWEFNYGGGAAKYPYAHVFNTAGGEGDRYCVSDSMQGMSCPAGCNSPLNNFSSVIAVQKRNLIIEIRETTDSKDDRWKAFHAREMAGILGAAR